MYLTDTKMPAACQIPQYHRGSAVIVYLLLAAEIFTNLMRKCKNFV
jgi:hypothetical protein